MSNAQMVGAMRRGNPTLRVQYRKPFVLVQLRVPLGPGRVKTFKARVDTRMIIKALRRHGVDVEIGFLGKLWKGIKKVGKAIGIDKVVKLAGKALPAVAAILPPPANAIAGGAALAFKAGKNLVKAVSHRRKGRKARARKIVQRTAKTFRKAKKVLGKKRARKALMQGARLYQLQVKAL